MIKLFLIIECLVLLTLYVSGGFCRIINISVIECPVLLTLEVSGGFYKDKLPVTGRGEEGVSKRALVLLPSHETIYIEAFLSREKILLYSD